MVPLQLIYAFKKNKNKKSILQSINAHYLWIQTRDLLIPMVT